MKLLEKLSQRNMLLIICTVSGVCFSFVLYYIIQISSISDGKGVLDFEFGYNIEQVNSYFHAYGKEGINLYKKMLFIDIFNPLLYTLTMMIFMYKFLKNTEYKFLIFTPILAGLMDYIENFYLYKMVNFYPYIDESIVSISNRLSIIKMLVLIVTVICFIISGVISLKRKKYRGQ